MDLYANVPDGPLQVEDRKPHLYKRCEYNSSRKKYCSNPSTGGDGLCTQHANMMAHRTIQMCERDIRDAGFTVSYVEFCENAETPGILGYYAGVTNHRKKTVRISTKKTTEKGICNRNVHEIAAIIMHELKHVKQPEWDCGNRKVI